MTNSLLNTYAVDEVRAELGRQRVSQRSLAERMGLSQAQISERMCGNVPFRLPELEAVADALGVPVSQFLPVPARAA